MAVSGMSSAWAAGSLCRSAKFKTASGGEVGDRGRRVDSALPIEVVSMP